MLGKVSRILILFLILRVTASPLALRPTAQRPDPDYRLVVRICSWPAPRPERSAATSVVLLDSTSLPAPSASLPVQPFAIGEPQKRFARAIIPPSSATFRESLRC